MLSRSLTTQEQEIVMQNKGLVYFVVNQYAFPHKRYDDAVQDGMIGLMKAVMTFDSNKGFTFAAYARRCITNEVCMYLRKLQPIFQLEMSLYHPIPEAFARSLITYEDILIDPVTSRFPKDIEIHAELICTISTILNCFSDKDRTILLYALANIRQEDVSAKFSCTQSGISRKIKKLKALLIKHLRKSTPTDKGIFFVDVHNEAMEISFFKHEIPNCNQVLANFLIKRLYSESTEEFVIRPSNKAVTLILPLELESFAVIADLLFEAMEITPKLLP